MANYLPVLLISVSNTVPDDSSLSTLPRAQVDYLSHDWQEEDVWKSWRNMTRQKNEITNGMRLENASWRTWWKQRNKLKTISPETLNWLKDSDVTWLYGPLHTAVDWTPPPPKLPPVPERIDGHAQVPLDLCSPTPTLSPRPCKPILKHRSISELLISNLHPTSPVSCPMDSEDEDDTHNAVSPTPSSTSFLSLAAGAKHKRPILTHTKSDSHITRWGAARAFRKESPPRIDPPGFNVSNQTQTDGSIQRPISESDSTSSGGAGRTGSGERTKKKHISFNTYVQQYIAIDKPKRSTSAFFPSQEGSWFTSRTTNPVDDGYAEDEEDFEEDSEQVYRRDTPVMRSYIGSPVEDDDDGIIEMRSSFHRNHTTTSHLVRSQSKVSTTSSSSSTSTTSSNTSHSHASTDTTSPTGSFSPSRTDRKPSPSSSSTATSRRSTSTYRPVPSTYTTRRGQPPPPIRTPSEHVHFTIAPIAPTILKTTGVWSEGFGDEEGSEDGFGSWDTQGLWSGSDTSAGNGKKGKGRTAGFHGTFGLGEGSDKEGQSSDGTPVELVYVPPFETNYGLGMGDDDRGGYLEEDEYKETEEYRDIIYRKSQKAAGWDVYHGRTGFTGSVGLSDNNGTSPSTSASIPIVRSPTPALSSVFVDDETTTSALSSSGLATTRGSSKTESRQWSSVDEEYEYGFFGGSDLGEDYYYAQRSSRRYDGGGVVPLPSSSSAAFDGGFSSDRQRERRRERRTVVQGGEERQSRPRSRSQSRTPSPAYISSPVPTAPAPTSSNSQVPNGRKRSSSASATPSGSFTTTGPLTNDLLSLPQQRGRNPQPQSQSQSVSRGRSSTRTASSSSSWDREGGSLVGRSPMGSLSPDGLVRAGGRGREKEKEREDRRGERRGRERMSVASEVESAASFGACAGGGSLSSHDAGGTNDRGMTNSKISSTTSSYSSSTSTVMGPPSDPPAVNLSAINKDQEHRANFLQQPEMKYVRRAEKQRRRVHPTPTSSPVIVRPEDRSGVLAASASDQRGGSIPSGTTFPKTAELTPSIPTPRTPPSSPVLTYTGHSRSSSYSESPSTPSKLRPPPLNPPPPLLVKPSTSFTAPASPIISSITTATSNKGLASPTTASSGEHTIVAKAVDIVSSAGAFLGLWQHSSIPGDK